MRETSHRGARLLAGGGASQRDAVLVEEHAPEIHLGLRARVRRIRCLGRQHAEDPARLRAQRSGKPIADDVRAALRKWYGPKGDGVKDAEAFEVCEYGRRPSEADLERIEAAMREQELVTAG